MNTASTFDLHFNNNHVNSSGDREICSTPSIPAMLNPGYSNHLAFNPQHKQINAYPRPAYSFYDQNRNNVVEQPYHPNKVRYHSEPPRTMNKSPYIMRTNISGVMPYSPYPLMPPAHENYLSAANADMFNRNANLKSNNFPFIQPGDYCNDILNRDKHYWTEEETGLMLELYEENRDYFSDTRTKKTKIWSIIAEMINKKFTTHINSEQCSQKYRNLKAEFLKAVDTNSPQEGEKKFGKHFTQMKRLIQSEEKLYQAQRNNSPPNRHDVSPNKLSPSDNNNTKSTRADQVKTPFQETTNGNAESNEPDKIDQTLEQQNIDLAEISTQKEQMNQQSNDLVDMTIEPKPLDIDITKGKPIEQQETVIGISASMENLIGANNQNNTMINSTVTEPVASDENGQDPSLNNSEQLETSLELPLQTQTNELNSFKLEVSQIFTDYMKSRDKMLEVYEVKEKENIKCMSRCVEIFFRVLQTKYHQE